MSLEQRLRQLEQCWPDAALPCGPYRYEDKPPFDYQGYLELCAEFAREHPADRVLRQQTEGGL